MASVDREAARLIVIFVWTMIAWLLIGVALFACVRASSVYTAERLACVDQHDAADEARACMRDVDRRWGQDGGLR